MKTILIALLFIAQAATAQIAHIDYKTPTRIGQFKRAMKGEIAWLEKTDTAYTLTFQNGDFSDLIDVQHVSFTGDATAADFYSTLKDCFNKPKGTNTVIVLGISTVMISTDKQMGVKMIRVRSRGGFWATQGNIDKLFGK